MILILMGKTASGKDSIAKELCRNYQFTRIVTYTTRPPRPNEVEGEDYHFISKSDFMDNVKHNFFVEWKGYQSAEGEWFYGTAAEDLNSGGVLILTPLGVRDFYRYCRCIARVVYIKASDETIMNRLTQRGDNPVEAKRRLEHDHEDFDIPAVNRLADYTVVNEGRTVSDIAEEIVNYWMREKERIYGTDKY
jgi:guanylate kinase